MHSLPAVATAHAVLTVAVGLWLAVSGRLDRVVYAAAYVAGSEVLWRMSGAAVFWESGKYAILLMFVVAFLRLRAVRWRVLPVLYFALLLPSIAVVPYDLLSDVARQQISFDLSGPATLAMSVLLLSQIRLGPREWSNTVIALAGPLAGIMAVAVYNTITAPTITFTLNANKVMSGGYGPNQVATVLGLGAALTFFAGIEAERGVSFRWTMLGIALAFAVQSALTFSRGGLYAAGGAIAVGSWYLLRRRRTRAQLLMGASVFSVTVALVILPALDRFTQGTLVARFEMTDTSGRDELVREDLRAFLAHPVTGLGPGGGYVSHARREAAHTEFARLLGEHGLLGVGAVLVLLAMAFRGLQAAHTIPERALIGGLLAWSFLTMAHSAMRVAAPSLAFGLAFAIPLRRDARPPVRARVAA